MWVRGLKHENTPTIILVRLSHPMWVRGLKQLFQQFEFLNRQSHPMWVRGLKPSFRFYDVRRTVVAPYEGAWIETLTPITDDKGVETGSHPMWVRGLKPGTAGDGLGVLGSHPMWVRGLKLLWQ